MAHGLTPAQFERLFEELEAPLYNVVYRWLWSPEDASEVVQEAFVRLWDMRGRVVADTARPLVFRVALNLASSRRRRTRRRLWRLPDPIPAALPDEDLVRDEQLRGLRRALEQLPEPLRQVIVMCELSELSYAEVADALEIKLGTVGSRRNTALKRLRGLLDDDKGATDGARA